MTHKKKKKNNKLTKINLKLILFIIVVIICILLLANRKITKYNDKTQIILDNENITSKLEREIIIENEQIYISYDDIKTYMDKTLYTEPETNLIISSSDKKVAVINIENQTLEINSSQIDTKKISVTKNGVVYLAISELQNLYNCEVKYINDTNIVTIESLSKKSVKAYAKKNLKVKENTNLFSKIVDTVKKENWIYVIEEQNGYAKVRTQDGIIGFVKSKDLTNFVNEREDFIDKDTFDEENALNIDLSKKDISTYEKRKEIINDILKDSIKKDKKYVQLLYEADNTQEFERFKIEAIPVLAECGIKAK